MAKAKKVLSVVLVALFTVMTVMSYVPAQAKAKKAATPQITIVEQPAAEYTVGDRMYAKVQAPNFTGKVEYRATLWDGTEKQIIEVWKTFPYYYKNWQPTGTTVFPITWIVEKPGVYNLTVYVRPVGSKASFSTYVKTANFTVKEKEVPPTPVTISSIADQTAAINEGETYALPAQLEAKMSDGSTKKVDVAWNTAVDAKKVGDQVITGKVTGYDKDVKLTLTVKAVPVTATVAAVGAKKFAVTFNKAVDTTKAVFAISKTNIPVNYASISWNDAKTVATITMSAPLTAGDYVVKTTGLGMATESATVTVKASTVTKIEFTSPVAVIDRTTTTQVTTSYAVYNQYDEDITASTTGLVFTSSKGSAVGTAGDLVIDASPASFTLDEKLAISVIHPTTSTYKSTVVNVAAKAQVSEIAITSLYDTNSVKRDPQVGLTAGDFKLVIDAKDQYGNAIAAGNIASDIIVTVSNASVADVAGGANNPVFSTTTIGGVAKTTLALAGALAEGTSRVTIISRVTGKLAYFDVVVKGGAKVDTVTLTAPTLAVAGEPVEIPFTAVDQFGANVTDPTVLNDTTTAGITFASWSGATPTFTKDYVKNVTRLTVQLPSSAGTVVLIATTKTGKIVQLPITVVAAAKPVIITGLKNTTTTIAKNGSTTLSPADILVNDQYGRAINITGNLGTGASNYKFVVSTSSGSYVTVNTTSAAVSITTNSAITMEGVAKGSSSMTIKLQKGDGTEVAGSAYTFTATVADKTDFVSYEVGTLSTVAVDATGAHAVSVKVYGVTASGDKVVVPTSYYTVNMLNSGNGIIYNTTTAAIEATSTAAFGVDDTTLSRTLVITVDAPVANPVLTATATISKAALVINELYLDDSTNVTVEDKNVISIAKANINSVAKVNAEMANCVKAYDQYGKDIVVGALNNVITNLPAGTAITAVAEGDTFNVTSITANGKVITVKVIVK